MRDRAHRLCPLRAGATEALAARHSLAKRSGAIPKVAKNWLHVGAYSNVAAQNATCMGAYQRPHEQLRRYASTGFSFSLHQLCWLPNGQADSPDWPGSRLPKNQGLGLRPAGALQGNSTGGAGWLPHSLPFVTPAKRDRHAPCVERAFYLVTHAL